MDRSVGLRKMVSLSMRMVMKMMGVPYLAKKHQKSDTIIQVEGREEESSTTFSTL